MQRRVSRSFADHFLETPPFPRSFLSSRAPAVAAGSAVSTLRHLYNILPQIHLLEHVLRKMIRALTRRFFPTATGIASGARG
jgi:hypothetical protein